MSEHEAEINISEGLSADDFIVEEDRIIIKSKSFARLVKGLKERLEERGREREREDRSHIHVSIGL